MHIYNTDSTEVSIVYQLLLSGYQPRHPLVGAYTCRFTIHPHVSFQYWPNGIFYGLPTSTILLFYYMTSQTHEYFILWRLQQIYTTFEKNKKAPLGNMLNFNYNDFHKLFSKYLSENPGVCKLSMQMSLDRLPDIRISSDIIKTFQICSIKILQKISNWK